jgi:succinate dehydrogenase / fumarate reductase membrane anchor subunit
MKSSPLTFKISRTLSFVVLRFTGIALAFLALGHFFLTHIANDVAETGSDFILARWNSLFWIIWDSALLICCAAHIVAGGLIIVYDYSDDKAKRSTRSNVVLSTVFVFLLIGLVILGYALFTIYGRS